jgi:putative ABC transport system permease protein
MRTDMIKYALHNIMHRKLRSYLTVLSILIGIMAIFTIVSFGQGLTHYTEEIFQKMGTDKLIMQAKGIGIPGLGPVKFSEEDVSFFRKIRGVSEVTGIMMEIVPVSFKDQKKPRYVYVMGSPVTGKEQRLVDELYTLEIVKGRGLKKSDKLKAVLGYNYQFPEKVFKRKVTLGDKILINNVQVDVVGFYEEVGNPQDDSNIYLSFDGFKSILQRGDEYSFITSRTSPGESPEGVAERATEKFRKRFNQKEGQEDFFIQTFEEAISTYNTVLLVLNVILFLIALISVIVAGVNIANTMYTSVLERTKEIGIMKAIGSRNRDIMTIFIIESGTLGLIGGLIGIFIGFLIAKTGGTIAAQAGLAMLHPYFPWWLVVGCIVFAFMVGAGAGILPALQAARQKPVEALRYE